MSDMGVDDFFKFFGRLMLTRKSSKSLSATIRSAGKNIDAEVFAGYYVVGSFLLGILLSVVLTWWPPDFFSSFFWLVNSIIMLESWQVFIIFFILAEILTFLLIWIITYVLLTLSIERRTKSIEIVLPDFLMFVSANVKAGMPLDQAIWYAAKPEFGLLSQEVKRVMKKSFGSQPLEDSLDELSKAFKSDLFNRTIILLKQAIATGSEIAEVLDRTSEEARESILLRKEIEASLVLYEIFILFASIFGTPFLFGVSTRLITILEKIFLSVPQVSIDADFYSMVQPAVAPIVGSAQFYWFAIGVILLTSLFSSFIMGVIRTGSRTQGFKYFPGILILSLIVYHLVVALLDTFFSSILL